MYNFTFFFCKTIILMKAIQALYEAQKLVFSPFIFQTIYTLYELKILEKISEEKDGLSIKSISDVTNLSEYGVGVLVEMAELSGILLKNKDDKFELTKIGYFILRDEMTRVNMMFTHEVCYKPLFSLKESIENGKPEGLKEFGNWKTIYEGLSQLPEKTKKSWFDFDHFYSDNSFNDALKIIFKHNPKKIFDIGANTGKWAIASTKYDPNVEVVLFDLPEQLKLAESNINKIDKIADRITYAPIDILDEQANIPSGADVYWMSQFLDCFSESEIESILQKIKKNAHPNARIFIMETFTDNQKYPAAQFSLVATSLYFTAIANGNSKMYPLSVFKYIIEKVGLKLVQSYHLHQDSFHTILEVKLS